MIERLAPYAAVDRLHALARGQTLPDRAVGSALSVDISGFTALTEQLAQRLGAREGAEALTRHLNAVYEVLVSEVHAHGGSVVGFAGDGFSVWLDGDRGPAALRAVACGLAIQRRFAETASGDPVRGSLALRVAVASGPVRRFAVGDPEVHRLDVLAGETMTRLAAADGLARSGEVIVDEATAQAAGTALEPADVRIDGAGRRSVVVGSLAGPADPDPWPPLPAELRIEDLRPWILPALWDGMRAGQSDAPTELRPAAALFLGFEGLDYDAADDAGACLDAFVRRVQTILGRYDGTLVQLTIGDKGSYLYAAFGAPVAHEDDAFRSVRAAVRLTRTAAEPPIGALRIGVSQGTMRVGAYGGRARRTYGVLGDEVNLAARLMQKATPGQPLFSGRIRLATRDVVEWGVLPAVRVKGREEPVPVFRVLGSRKDATPAASSLVGREDERMGLAWAVDRLTGGAGGALILEGDAGLGKSRLVEELVAEAEARALTVCVGTADALECTQPFFAWRGVLATLLGLGAEDVARAPGVVSETIGVGGLTRGLSSSTSREPEAHPELGEKAARRVRERVAEAAPDMATLAPLLNTVLRRGLPETDRTRDMDAPVRASSTLELLARLVRHGATRAPLVVVIEDTQWLDSASWALVERVAGSSGLLLVLAGRPPGDTPPPELAILRERPDTLSIRLGPVPSDAVALIAARTLGAERLSQELAALLDERAEGSPLVALELARSLLEGGHLEIAGGEARPSGGGEAAARLALPDTMEALVLGRVDHLPPMARQLIKVASVIGRRFSFGTLRKVTEALDGSPPEDQHLASALVALEKAGLAEPLPTEGEAAWAFSSGVTQEVVHRLMTSEQRRALHFAVAELYETEAGSSDLAVLAHHWVQAGEISRARPCLEQAAETALRGGAWSEAARLYGQLLDAPEDGGEAEDARRQRAAWQIRFAVARAGAGRVVEAREHARAALALLGQRTGGSLVGAALVSGARDLGFRRLAPTPARRAALVDAAEAYERLAELHYLSDDPMGGLREALRGLALALRTEQDDVRSRLQSAVALALGVAPLHALSRRLMRGAVRAARATDDPATVGLVSEFAAIHAFGLGRWSEARDLVHEALERYEALGNRHRTLELRNTLAAMAYTRGELARAGGLFADLARDATAAGNSRARSWAEVGQALVAFRTGNSALGLRLLGTRRAATVEPLARLQLRETHEALEALPASLARARIRPIKCWTMERFTLPAEVVLSLREAESDFNADERARLAAMEGEALAAARRFARVFPIGGPREARLRGLSHWLGGRRDRARRAWEASLASAERLEMPWDEAHARLEIARHAPAGSAEQARHLDRATSLLKELGAFDDRDGAKPAPAP